MKLFVAGLPNDMDDQELKEIFEGYGKVAHAKVILDKETGLGRGFGFVDMQEKAEALGTIARLDGGELEGKKLIVRPAEERKKTNGRRTFRG